LNIIVLSALSLTLWQKTIATYTENDEILCQRAFLRKNIEIIKTLNCTTLNQYV